MLVYAGEDAGRDLQNNLYQCYFGLRIQSPKRQHWKRWDLPAAFFWITQSSCKSLPDISKIFKEPPWGNISCSRSGLVAWCFSCLSQNQFFCLSFSTIRNPSIVPWVNAMFNSYFWKHTQMVVTLPLYSAEFLVTMMGGLDVQSGGGWYRS